MFFRPLDTQLRTGLGHLKCIPDSLRVFLFLDHIKRSVVFVNFVASSTLFKLNLIYTQSEFQIETPPLHLFIRDLLGVFLSNGTRGVSPPTSLHVSVAATLQWLFCLVSNWDFKLKEAWVELRSLWWGERMKMRDSWGAKKLCTAAHTAVPLPLPLCVKKQLGKPQVNGFRMKFFLKQRKT